MLRVGGLLTAGHPPPTAGSSATREHGSAPLLTAGDKGWVQRLAGLTPPASGAPSHRAGSHVAQTSASGLGRLFKRFFT